MSSSSSSNIGNGADPGLVGMSIGPYSVVTTTDGGHPPEFFAERISERLMYVSSEAPPVIREQALAFQAHLRGIVLHGVKQAILSNHTTVINRLRKAGMPEAAQLVYEMRNERT